MGQVISYGQFLKYQLKKYRFKKQQKKTKKLTRRVTQIIDWEVL